MKYTSFKFATLALAIVALTGCQKEQSSFNIEDVPGEAKIMGTLAYDAGQGYNNGIHTQIIKAAANVRVVAIVDNSTIIGSATSKTVYETKTDASGNYTITVPAHYNGEVSVEVSAYPFFDNYSKVIDVENGAPQIEVENVLFKLAPKTVSVTPNDIEINDGTFTFTERDFLEAYKYNSTFVVKVGEGIYKLGDDKDSNTENENENDNEYGDENEDENGTESDDEYENGDENEGENGTEDDDEYENGDDYEGENGDDEYATRAGETKYKIIQEYKLAAGKNVLVKINNVMYAAATNSKGEATFIIPSEKKEWTAKAEISVPGYVTRDYEYYKEEFNTKSNKYEINKYYIKNGTFEQAAADKEASIVFNAIAGAPAPVSKVRMIFKPFEGEKNYGYVWTPCAWIEKAE